MRRFAHPKDRLLALLLIVLLVAEPALAGLTIIQSNGIAVTGADGVSFINAAGIAVTGADGFLSFAPNGIAVTMTADAADKTADSLHEAAKQAREHLSRD